MLPQSAERAGFSVTILWIEIPKAIAMPPQLSPNLTTYSNGVGEGSGVKVRVGGRGEGVKVGVGVIVGVEVSVT
jgi:hypothetical protein